MAEQNKESRRTPDKKPEKKLPGDEERAKEKRLKEHPERVNQDPQFDPSHIQEE